MAKKYKFNNNPLAPPYDIDEEKIENIKEKLVTWIQKEDVYTLNQFLRHAKLGWSYFRWCVECDVGLKDLFEIVKAELHGRWLKMVFQEKIPTHREKVLLKYLRLYDSYELQIEQDMKRQLQWDAEYAKVNATYEIENWKDAELTGENNKIYQSNLNKRRSGA